MAESYTLPAQGGSNGTWGTELNNWLKHAHTTAGKHNTLLCYENEVLCYENDVLEYEDN